MIVLYRLFRGIQGPEATPEDFFSNKRKGLKPRLIERQHPREHDPGHWNAWGDPEAFLQYITAVHPVVPPEQE